MQNWEVPEAVDYIQLGKTLDQQVAKARQFASENADIPTVYVFVEGFLLFANEDIRQRLDWQIFLTISKTTCWRRRQSTKPVPPKYFAQALWPAFVKYNALDLLQSSDAPSRLVILDADANDQESLHKAALSLLQGSHVPSSVGALGALQWLELAPNSSVQTPT